jgi:hypothetical protein
MGAWKHRGGSDWDFAVVVYAVVVLSAATDVYGFQRFAPALGLPAWAGSLWVIPVKFVEWKFLTFALRLFKSGLPGKFIFPATVVAWCIAVLMSMLAAHSTVYNALASGERFRAKKVETRANLSAELDALKAQIASLSDPRIPRPVKVVEETLGWLALPEDVRRITRDCTRFVNDGQRDACKDKISLRKELVTAKEYERLSSSLSKLRSRLEGIDIEAAEDPMPRSFEISIGRLVNMDGKDGIAVMGMLILTLVSALGPFGLDLIGRVKQDSLRAGPTSFVGGSAQEKGQGGQGALMYDEPPNSSAKSAHNGFAHEPARPARQPAQPNGMLPAWRPELAPREPAHESAQASLREGVGSARFQPAHDHQQYARPPIGEPARSPINCRAGQTKRPARRYTRGVAKGGPTDKVVRLAVPDTRREALNAIRSFVAMLEHAPSARTTGSALADAYEALRAGQGWPEIPRNVFGTLLRIAVEELGGRKLKSGSQVYEGVRIPAGWGMRVAA